MSAFYLDFKDFLLGGSAPLGPPLKLGGLRPLGPPLVAPLQNLRIFQDFFLKFEFGAEALPEGFLMDFKKLVSEV